jgi:hypothetical protein
MPGLGEPREAMPCHAMRGCRGLAPRCLLATPWYPCPAGPRLARPCIAAPCHAWAPRGRTSVLANRPLISLRCPAAPHHAAPGQTWPDRTWRCHSVRGRQGFAPWSLLVALMKPLRCPATPDPAGPSLAPPRHSVRGERRTPPKTVSPIPCRTLPRRAPPNIALRGCLGVEPGKPPTGHPPLLRAQPRRAQRSHTKTRRAKRILALRERRGSRTPSSNRPLTSALCPAARSSALPRRAEPCTAMPRVGAPDSNRGVCHSPPCLAIPGHASPCRAAPSRAEPCVGGRESNPARDRPPAMLNMDVRAFRSSRRTGRTTSCNRRHRSTFPRSTPPPTARQHR